MGIVACPFCREMFEDGEASACPVCGVALAPLERLPPSHDAREDEIPVEPEHEPLPASYMGRGRGALLAVALVGLVAFFLPWVHVTLPDRFDLSGFDMARRLGWSWGAAVAWVVLVPTVASRRSIHQLRGARVAAAFLSAVPAATVTILLLRPPHSGLVPVRFTWGTALFVVLAASLAGAVLSLRLGGRVDDIRVDRGSSAGQELH